MKKKILFVDDEPKVLGGLRRMLHGLRTEWDMMFVESGPEAIVYLGRSPFDVIVTDMRMPVMDGAQLLSHVAELYPSVVRIILSGQCEPNAVLKCVGPTHQFLTKPCDSETLKSTVARACRLRDCLPNEQAKQAISRIQSLPSRPSLYAELIDELQSAVPSIQHISRTISQDPAMTAKVLQLVSSGFFGTPRRVHSAVEAVELLGLDTIRELTNNTNSFAPLEQDDSYEKYWNLLAEHSLAVAEAAKRIAQAETEDNTLIADTYLAGMLHDIAVYSLGKESPELYLEALSRARHGQIDLAQCEEQIFHMRRDHAGACLMGLWGLPDQIVNTIANHLSPSNASDLDFGPLAAVHIANAIIEEIEQDVAELIGRPNRIDSDFLKRIGCTDRLETWREICLTLKSEGVLA